MTVTLLYFAAVAELVGISEEARELPPFVATVGELARWLEQVHPALAERLKGVRIARNEVFAAEDERIAHGDVIALIPPVCGG